MSGLWRNTTFRRLFFGRLVTNVGDSLYLIAAMWLVHTLSGSVFYTGVAAFLTRLPRALQFLTGPLVDRWPIRRVLVATQVIQGTLVLTVPLADATGHLTVHLVLALIPVLAMLNQFVYPAQNAALPRIVDEGIVRANSLFSMAYTGVDATFNAIAGVAITVIGAVAIYAIDSVTFFVAALLFVSITVPEADAAGDESVEGYVEDLSEGFEYIRRTALKYIAASGVLANFALGISTAVLPAFSDTRGGADMYGAMLAALAAGSLTGAVLAPRLKHVSFGRLLIVAFSLGCVTWIASVASPWVPATIGLFYLAWIPVGIFNVSVQTIRQVTVPEGLIGRVTSAMVSAAAAAAPVGALAGGTGGSLLGSDVMLAIAGLGFLSIVAFFSLNETLRQFPPVGALDVGSLET